jgi:hypothetical protein
MVVAYSTVGIVTDFDPQTFLLKDLAVLIKGLLPEKTLNLTCLKVFTIIPEFFQALLFIHFIFAL